MLKRIVSEVMLTLLFIGMLTFTFNIQPASSEWTGTVYIRADGSIDPPDAPVITYDNVTYTLTGNITSSGDGIVVERDNIIINGNGYVVQGKPIDYSTGVRLSERNNVSVENIGVKGFVWGIYLFDSSMIKVNANNLINNTWGVLIRDSSKNSIKGNIIVNSKHAGLFFDESSENEVIDNTFINDGMFVWESYDNIVVNNWVNGKPLIYLEGSSDMEITIAGQVILINCTQIRIKNLNLSNVYVGVQLLKTNGCEISGNSVSNCEWSGIFLDGSSFNNITRNELKGTAIAIAELSGPSEKNLISENDVRNFDGVAILVDGNDNVICRNNVTNNGVGIFVIGSGIIFGNNVNANEQGICAVNGIIFENNVTNNKIGIDVFSGKVYHNNFIGNKVQARAGSCTCDNGYPSGGNYWSDYNGTDLFSGPYQNVTGSDGIGDTPYIINSYNRDNYPLMYPYGSPLPPYYNLTIRTMTGGITEPSQGTYAFANGTIVSITAIPDTGYSFDYWLFDGETRTENPIIVVMDSNHTLEAYFIDDIPPEISEPIQDPLPNNVEPFQNVTVWVNVTDYGSGIKNVTLWYSVDNGTSWTVINMTEHTALNMTVTYMAIIPGYKNCTCVIYKIIAYDNAGNVGIKDNGGYPYRYHVLTLITAKITISPHLLNLKSNEMWITAYVELPEGYNVNDINVSSILLNGTIPADLSAPIAIGDYDNDTVQDLMVCFNWSDLAEYILSRDVVFGNITLKISGKLYNGSWFTGTDIVLVSSLVGDVNTDGTVDIQDILVAALSFGSYPTHPRWNPNADFTKDSYIGIDDICLIARNFGKQA